MQNRYGTRGISKVGLIVICCILTLVLAALIAVAVGMTTDRAQETPDETQKGNETQSDLIVGSMDEMVIYAIEEREDVMYVTTSYGAFSYPYAFSDLLVIEEVNQDSCVGLIFSAFLEEKYEQVYTLWINSNQGMQAGSLHREDKTYRVSIEMYEAREDMSEIYISTYYAVQETLNDVLQSMEAGGDFVYSAGEKS